MYDMALWKYYSATTYCKLKSAYNKCVKKMFGYTRRDSMTGVFLQGVSGTVAASPVLATIEMSVRLSVCPSVTR